MMKKILAAAVLMLAMSAAQSFGFTLQSGYEGQIKLNISGVTQNVTNGETWGLFKLDSVRYGTTSSSSVAVNDVYGIIYGLSDYDVNYPMGTANLKGGYFALYEVNPSKTVIYDPTKYVSGTGQYTGITDGTLLLGGAFAKGILGDDTTVQQQGNMVAGVFNGFGAALGNVTGGTLFNAFNTDGITSYYTQSTYDLKFDITVFGDDDHLWSQDFNSGVKGNVVPEPGTMALLGFGMLGLAIFGKRRMNREA